eukprot:gene7454-biopygen15087
MHAPSRRMLTWLCPRLLFHLSEAVVSRVGHVCWSHRRTPPTLHLPAHIPLWAIHGHHMFGHRPGIGVAHELLSRAIYRRGGGVIPQMGTPPFPGKGRRSAFFKVLSWQALAKRSGLQGETAADADRTRTGRGPDAGHKKFVLKVRFGNWPGSRMCESGRGPDADRTRTGRGPDAGVAVSPRCENAGKSGNSTDGVRYKTLRAQTFHLRYGNDSYSHEQWIFGFGLPGSGDRQYFAQAEIGGFLGIFTRAAPEASCKGARRSRDARASGRENLTICMWARVVYTEEHLAGENWQFACGQ